MKSQLLCTFTFGESLDQALDSITQNYDVLYGKIFVLENADKQYDYMCTYNVTSAVDFNILGSTISLHRKRHTNTLYTINALNTLIKSVNGNELDPTFQVDWNEYQNCLLTTNAEELRRINTNIHKVVHIK